MKQAYCDIDDEIVPQCISILADHGLKLVSAARGNDFTLRALIEGDALPDECATETRRVSMTISSETYGKQKINRVTAIHLVD